MNINSGGSANLFRIPKSLVASSLEELERLMLLNNLKNSTEFRYFDIQKDGRNWVAFFYFEIPVNGLIKEQIEKDKDGPSK